MRERLRRFTMTHLLLALGLPAGVFAQRASAPSPAAPQTTSAAEAPTRPRPTLVSRRSRRVVPFEAIRVSSPDGTVTFTLLPNAEQLGYTVAIGDTTVIERSTLRVSLDGYDLSSGVVVGAPERFTIEETYPWYGVRGVAKNRCHGVRIPLVHDLSFIGYTLEVRAFDDGIAYRHLIPGEEGVARVPDERSTFVVPAGSTVWYGDMDGHYETEYKNREASAIQAGEWAGPPVTFELPGHAGYGAITEANLVDYAGMGLEADGHRGFIVGLGHRQPLNFPYELRYGREEARRLGRPASIKGTITTPWRVVLAARDLNALATSTIIPNLCPPPDPVLFPAGLKTPWIKPGRAVWRYVDDGPDGYEGLKEFSRLGSRLGFEHHVIEGVWSRWTMEERKQLADDARRQGVGLWFWKHSRELRTDEAREQFFSMLHHLGVVGAKVDFFDNEAKETVDLYEALLRKAAEHQVSIIFHGANKPTGRERTWPNDAVHEAVRGMEARSFQARARHQTVLPFTRYLAGGADYTGVVFNERRGDTSWAHQAASMVVLSSPLLTIGANPQAILDSPAVDVLKSVPSVWDETIVLPPSRIGEMAAYARRSGDNWFLAVMCGPQSRSVEIPLSFLDEGGYRATLVRDVAGNPAALAVETGPARGGDAVRLQLEAGGGFLGRYSRDRQSGLRGGSSGHKK